MRTPLLSTLFCVLTTLSMHAQNTSPYWSLNGNSNATLSQKLGTTNNVSLRFVTNNIERMKIHSSGNIGIGTSSPTSKLHVVGNTLFQGYSQIQSKDYVGLDVTANVVTGDPYLDYEITTEVGIKGTADYSGVEGYATYRNGQGVYGGGDIGVWGEGNEYGVIGRGSTYGVYGIGLNSSSVGVYGYSADNYAGFFDGEVYSTSQYTTSDQNLKKDISEVGGALAVIGQLKPKYYTFRNDGKYAKMNLPKGNHYGFMAQDLEKVLPGLVKTTQHRLYKEKRNEQNEEITLKAVNYTELIPIAVKAIQEQQQVIDQQKQELDALKNELAEIKQAISMLSNGQNINTFLSSAQLGEVSPNPVRGSATIQYSIPEGSGNVQLVITDAMGRIIRQIPISTTGAGVINIDASSLASGVYNCALLVNYKTIHNRKMTVVK
ncbi:tail fiber domain-containing protein [Chitinophagaceae bacterium LB-8]|uniref:Tail fiber domain-containing protein n=1 Tax=Paraflavisolibacter caeni TaxID=2982496 RepID=A0A9X2XWQ7_9BACT|nr:tail fiber domain-containing protein [Paraflavisolibacter caeni]MCU7549932.1 tail fiber domain-containing protein [Paraflavisolibacter caeni]